MIVGYHASHEQFPPGELLRHLLAAEAAGFGAAMCSDHLAPWTRAQGHSGFAWSWLGAALALTRLPIGVVTAPGQRYHPAVVARGAATLAEMFPGRFWLALGSGEAINEHVTGAPWPPKGERNARLRECADVIRALLAGEAVTHRGRVVVDRARVWSLPREAPALLGAAVSAETAAWLASWADGLITVSRPLAALREVVEAFRRHGGEGKRLVLQAQISWADDLRAAERAAHEQWRMSVLPGDVLWDLETPEAVEAATARVRPEELHAPVDIVDDMGALARRLREWRALGFHEVYLHHVGRDQRAFLDRAGAELLPALPEGP